MGEYSKVGMMVMFFGMAARSFDNGLHEKQPDEDRAEYKEWDIEDIQPVEREQHEP
jgi:hypothetical protein